jgi:hypothetical protein
MESHWLAIAMSSCQTSHFSGFGVFRALENVSFQIASQEYRDYPVRRLIFQFFKPFEDDDDFVGNFPPKVVCISYSQRYASDGMFEKIREIDIGCRGPAHRIQERSARLHCVIREDLQNGHFQHEDRHK